MCAQSGNSGPEEIEFGSVKDGSEDCYYGVPPSLYDHAVKPFSKTEVHIARIPRKHLLWLAESVCACLTEAEFDDLMARLEDKAVFV